MSKNITIQEGGIAKQLTVDKLKTNLVGGGTCLWVPEDEIILGTKSITNNGTYSASDDGLTGFSQVNVNVQGDSVTGRDPVTGQEKSVTVDPETGDLVETVVPSEIRVITPPTNPYGVYVDGQTITKDGMVVKAYDANGVYMQDVPVGEITINPTVAVYDKTKDTGEYTIDDTSVLQHPNAYNLPLKTSGVLGYTYYNTITAEIVCNAGKLLAINGVSRCFSETPTTIIRTDTNQTTQKTDTYSYNVSTSVQTLISRKTVYYNNNGWNTFASGNTNIVGVNNTMNGTFSMADIATILFDGVQQKGQGSDQTITVSWPRPRDGKVLTATFNILVAPGYGGDEGENGNAGTPPPGMLIP